MMTNETIYYELRRLVMLTTTMDGQIRDLTARLDAVERDAAPRGLAQIDNWEAANSLRATGEDGVADD